MAACPRCGEANPGRARFCLACGAPLEEPAAPREMRKTVTVVFSDVIDSTQLGEQLDAETYRRVISRYFIEVSRVLEHHGGTVEKFIGDAVMAVFGIPIVHEDDALRAVRAATELREALALLNAELRPEYGIELAVRTGINTGEVVAGDPGEGQAFATGEAVAVAQRLEATASPGEILMGEATQRLVRDAVLVEPVKPLTLKGKSEAVQAWRLLGVVTGAPAFARRLDSPLVGRERELALLEQAFRRAADERASHLFTVLGAAGVGKSRLVNELVSSLRDEARVLIGRCVPYGEGITFWPLTELVRQAAGITPRMSAKEARERLASLLSQEPEAELIVDRLTAATGLVEGDAKNEETFWAVRKLLEALAREGPLIACFDDVQWAEPTFLDLLDHLADWTRNAPVFLICLARPELLDTRPDWGGGKLNATSILLEPLRAEDVELLIENLLEEGEAPEELLRTLRDTGEGNPLFVEELLEMLIDRGRLRRENGGWRTEGRLEALDTPPTIHALLAARLDRLSEDERDVVERAAVVGKLFSHDELVALLPEGDSPGELLSSLVRKDLIRPDRTGEDAFRFRHQLIRDAAYQGLAKESRAELHERFAAWLEQTRPDRLREHEEILGYHLEQAHRYRADLAPADERTDDLAARAAALLASAGRRAFSRGDMPAAVALLTRATLLLRDDEAGRLEVAPELARALVETGELARAEAVLERTVEKAAAAGNRRVEWLARIARTQLQLYTDPERSLDELAQESEAAVAVFDELGDALGLARAWTSVAERYWWRGRIAEMEPVLERALLYAREVGDERQAAFVLNTLLRAVPVGPRPVEDALRRCRELLAKAGSDRTLESLGALMIGSLEAMRGRFEEARSCCEHSKAVAAELGLTVQVASRSLYAALVELLAGDPSAAELELRRGYESLEAMGETGRLSTITALLAETLYLQGRYDEAERFTAVSEESASKEDLITHVMWKQTRAKLLARRGDQEAAEGLAREAVRLAESTDLLNIRGETLVNLAEVLRAGGQPEDAAKAAEAATAQFEAKGNLVQTGRSRELLDALDRSSARR